MQDIDHISFKGKAWIRFTEGLISVGFKELPSDIHYSLSYSKNSKDINFHVTRNVNDPYNKPKFEVFRISNQLFDEIQNDIAIRFLRLCLKELKIDELQNTDDSTLRYISHEDLEKTDFYNITEGQLKHLTANAFKLKGRKKLQVLPCIETKLDKLEFREEKFIELYKKTKILSDVTVNGIQSGLIFSGTKVFSVITFNNRWYIPLRNNNLEYFLKGIFGSELTSRLNYRLKKGIVIVKNAFSFEEIKHLNKPIRIGRRKNN